MADWNAANLRLIADGIVGGKLFYYEDTGPVGDLADVDGRATDGYDYGLRTGDSVLYRDTSRNWQYLMNVRSSTDTGATQTTFGAAVLVGDTS